MLQLLMPVTITLTLVNSFSIDHAEVNRKEEQNQVTSGVSPDQSKSYYLSIQVPQNILQNCKIQYKCKSKLKNAEVPKPCIKYCIKEMECENGVRTRGLPDQCIILNEQLIADEYNNNCKVGNSYADIQPSAMIDFPCQPGYLPDYKGRCREIW